ncbi:hypothetical protein IFM89_017935 [Coptis chinensis]|uniref:Oberon PHD finger domain-containing protein n=1 Tax=Coptis chinensis TaxID=261450 RepID=A0A835HWQ3_9MAGN|nr:hypothetical protein IFM89_017935 [Coptis chinensis]
MEIIKSQSTAPDVPDGNNHPEAAVTKKDLSLWPVACGESGMGLPYAPIDWPEPGDIWGWKVGTRENISGIWQDRYLYLPSRLQKSLRVKSSFPSKPAVERFLQQEFPDTDMDAFFSSFNWRIPSREYACAEGGSATQTARNGKKKKTEHSRSESKVEAVDCKVGNWMCRLQLQAKNYSMPAMDCDICCGEVGFCRDCCCILCCKTVDWAYGGYSFIRCEAKVNESYICAHVAHMDCALRSYMAGTVGGSNGLDVEYYCRRCDKKTDLIIHVKKLLQTCESLNSQDDVEKILKMGLCILCGSQRERSTSLLHNIELALTKLISGACLGDIWNSEDRKAGISAGKITHSRRNGALPQVFDNVQQTQQPVYITSDNRLESSEIKEKIERALQDLTDSQEYEYKIAKESLCDQKDFILDLYHQLDTERSELAKRTSSSADCNIDALVTNILKKVNQIKREVLKLKDMEEVAKGFGRVPKEILKEHFDLQIEE